MLFNVESQQNPRNGVYLVRPDGNGLHRILRSNETFIFYKPDFSPGGKLLILGCYVVAEQQEDVLHGGPARAQRHASRDPAWRLRELPRLGQADHRSDRGERLD